MHLDRDIIFVGRFPDRSSTLEQVANKLVLVGTIITQPLEIQHHVICVGENVIIPIEQEMSVGAKFFHPFQEKDLLECEVEEGIMKVPLQNVIVFTVLHFQEFVQPPLLKALSSRPGYKHGTNPNAVLQPLGSPCFPQHLPSLVIGWRTLDNQQKKNV